MYPMRITLAVIFVVAANFIALSLLTHFRPHMDNTLWVGGISLIFINVFQLLMNQINHMEVSHMGKGLKHLEKEMKGVADGLNRIQQDSKESIINSRREMVSYIKADHLEELSTLCDGFARGALNVPQTKRFLISLNKRLRDPLTGTQRDHIIRCLEIVEFELSLAEADEAAGDKKGH